MISAFQAEEGQFREIGVGPVLHWVFFPHQFVPIHAILYLRWTLFGHQIPLLHLKRVQESKPFTLDYAGDFMNDSRFALQQMQLDLTKSIENMIAAKNG